ncbi:phosphate acetyltransferase [Anaerofilum sp. BX8]|uniref:Phosphate acetyltransferase n=1 Tax=Anaerofilum hominis TaxID=2763016 RepID=A0A923I9A3_9FIRM|nr:phosphate acetyltransferase [Anaerofilum hominis]MBC5581277.1 phosphate acetyltransferase [Anaerofilum hominis]
MLEKLVETLKIKNKRLIYTEGCDPRILEAASRLHREGLLTPVLVGEPEAVRAAAENAGFDIEGIEIVDPMHYDGFEAMVDKMTELRKGKMTADECAAALKKANYFGTMYVKLGLADGLLGGATYSTADTVRPALQIVKTRPGSKIVSSCFIMDRTGADGKPERYAMADCAINLHPSAEELVEIAVETAKTASFFGIDPKVALLSYSTLGSGKGEDVDKVRAAAALLKDMDLPFPVEGELQFDAAFAPEVGKLKAPGSRVAGEANVFVFPDINAGNIGYKIAQRLGGFEAVGPILQGLAANINDLSRGCSAEEVYKMSIITAGME